MSAMRSARSPSRSAARPLARPASVRRARAAARATAANGVVSAAPDAAPSAAQAPSDEPSTSQAAVQAAKMALLRAAAATDRGQLLFNQKAYAPLDRYAVQEGAAAQAAIDELVASRGAAKVEPAMVDGEWELVYASKQPFRSSPFFMAIEAAFGEATHSSFLSGNEEVLSSELFFRLHELQVKSFGASTIGRVRQTVDLGASSLTSSFDTILFALTTVPLIGFGKLLPTFGAEVRTYSDSVVAETDEVTGALKIAMQVDKTEVLEREGIPTPPFPLPQLLGVQWPVRDVWKMLPWNDGKVPTAETTVIYADQDMRINQDIRDSYFVYTRLGEAPQEAAESNSTA